MKIDKEHKSAKEIQREREAVRYANKQAFRYWLLLSSFMIILIVGYVLYEYNIQNIALMTLISDDTVVALFGSYCIGHILIYVFRMNDIFSYDSIY